MPLHEAGIIHSDLRENNIIVRKKELGVRLIDFGSINSLIKAKRKK
ncbi:MAG: protein kinase domain-containing protein [Nitrososphaerales archaeon]